MHSSTVKVLFILNCMRDPDGTMRGPADRNLHFVIFDKSSDLAYHNYLELARIIRRRAFVDELGVPCDIENDSKNDTSRHSLGFFGDAPVNYARWSMDERWIVVDRLCTLKGYRNRGVARSCLENILRSLSVSASRSQSPLSGLIVLVPKTHRILQEKLAQANFFPAAESATECMSCTRMCLTVHPMFSSA